MRGDVEDRGAPVSSDFSPNDIAVLIHGAWQGSWAWDHLVPLLEAAGIPTLAVDLPGNGSDGTDDSEITLDAYLAFFDRLLESLPGTVSLVGHSGGGLVATAVAEAFRERVSRIAYVAGMMLPPGLSFAALQAEMESEVGPAPGISGELVWSADRRVSTVPRAAAKAIFFSDCTDDLASLAADRLTPQPEGARAISVATTPDRFGTLPRLYVEATEDRSVLLPLQRRMQALVPGARVVSLPTGHAPQLSAPDLLAQALIPFLQGPAIPDPHGPHETRSETGVHL